MKKIIALTLIGLVAVCGSSFARVTEGDLRKTVSNIGTAEALSSTGIPYKRAIICAEEDNVSAVVLGGATAVASVATRRGIPIIPIASDGGTCVELKCDDRGVCGNLDSIYLDTMYDGDGVTVFYTQS